MKIVVTPWRQMVNPPTDYVLECFLTLNVEGRIYTGRVVSKSEADGWDERDKRAAIRKKAREFLTDALYEQYPELFDVPVMS